MWKTIKIKDFSSALSSDVPFLAIDTTDVNFSDVFLHLQRSVACVLLFKARMVAFVHALMYLVFFST